MPKKITELTEEQKGRFKEWVDKWVKIGLSTEPANFDKATNAALQCYDLIGLKRPMVVLHTGSPLAATLGGGMVHAALKKLVGSQVRPQAETGHHHVLSRNDGCDVVVMDNPPEGMRILYAILDNPTSLDHLRPHDTHESIMLDPGIYEFRIAREYDPYAELARQSQD